MTDPPPGARPRRDLPPEGGPPAERDGGASATSPDRDAAATPPDPDPDAELTLRRGVRALARAARLLERAGGGMSLSQYRLLALVARGDERASLLADRLAIARPTVTAVVDGLVERGWLARSAVAADRRALRISMTPAGGVALAEAETTMARELAATLDAVGTRERVLSALGELEDALDVAAMARLGLTTRGRS